MRSLSPPALLLPTVLFLLGPISLEAQHSDRVFPPRSLMPELLAGPANGTIFRWQIFVTLDESDQD